jgi:phosphohistidine phosphatase
MAHVVLLRHAEARLALPGETDFERPLTRKGEADAARVGQELTAEFFTQVLCSPSLRTRQTLALARGGGLRLGEIDFDSSIYEASAGDLLLLLEAYFDEPNLLIIGHNPAIEQIASMLSKKRVLLRPGDWVMVER